MGVALVLGPLLCRAIWAAVSHLVERVAEVSLRRDVERFLRRVDPV